MAPLRQAEDAALLDTTNLDLKGSLEAPPDPSEREAFPVKMRFYYNLLYRIVWPFFCLVHPIRSIGRENIPEGGAVFCANHSALADPLMVCFAATLRWHIRPMAKIELSRVPLVGWLLGKAGVIYVDRGHADVKAVKEALTCLKAGGKMLVFPRATRVHDGEDVSAKGEPPCSPPDGGAHRAGVCLPEEVLVPPQPGHHRQAHHPQDRRTEGHL